MKPFVDLYGGFGDGEWKTPDVYRNATILDAERKGPVVIEADEARLDGLLVTGGGQRQTRSIFRDLFWRRTGEESGHDVLRKRTPPRRQVEAQEKQATSADPNAQTC